MLGSDDWKCSIVLFDQPLVEDLEVFFVARAHHATSLIQAVGHCYVYVDLAQLAVLVQCVIVNV